MRPKIATLVASTLVVALAWIGSVPASAAEPPLVGGRFSDCFWNYGAVGGDIGGGKGEYNIAYPDAGATYWAAYYRRPEGSTLTLRGKYPHSRYTALQSYDILGRGVDALADYQLGPDHGSKNPFRNAKRTTRKRNYTVNVIDEPNPGFPLQAFNGEDARNDIYTTPASGPLTETVGGKTYELELLMIRVYVPDKGRNLTGGVGLPNPKLKLEDGTVLRGQQLCDATDSESKDLGSIRLPDPSALLISEDAYKALRYPDQLSSPFDVFAGLMAVPRTSIPAEFPAVEQGQWRAQYDRRYLLQLWTGDDAPGANATPPPRAAAGGFFPNAHNAYVRTAIHRGFGKIAVFRGKLPSAPPTHDGERRLGDGDVRYASYCMNESPYTTKVMDCVYDEEVPTNGRGIFTIVVSRNSDRPGSARRKCGKAWIDWSERGDGYLDRDFGWFQIRNMLPEPGFEHAIQYTSTPGDEKQVMGRYLPNLQYFKDAKAFERSSLGGC